GPTRAAGAVLRAGRGGAGRRGRARDQRRSGPDDPSDQQPREDPSPAPRPDRCRPNGPVGARSGPFLIRAVGVRAGQPASIADATPKSPPTNSSQSSLADDIPLPLV